MRDTVIKTLLILALLFVSFISLLSYAARGNHYLELLSHFRMQYLSIQLLCLMGLLALKRWRFASLALGCMVINLFVILPYYLPPTLKPNMINSKPLRILQINLLGPNQDHQKVLELIQEVKPDIIGAEEVRPRWATTLQKNLKDYPYRIVEPEATAFGIALFSKYPLSNIHIVKFGSPFGSRKRFFPSIVADIQVGKQPVTVLVTHPLPPLRGFNVRNSQLADIARNRPTYQENLILIGDLNVTPWSPYFQDLIKATGLRDSQLSLGVQSSWKSPIPGVMIPIDHILLSKKFTVISRKLGRDIGSDHLPVLVDVRLKQ